MWAGNWESQEGEHMQNSWIFLWILKIVRLLLNKYLIFKLKFLRSCISPIATYGSELTQTDENRFTFSEMRCWKRALRMSVPPRQENYPTSVILNGLEKILKRSVFHRRWEMRQLRKGSGYHWLLITTFTKANNWNVFKLAVKTVTF